MDSKTLNELNIVGLRESIEDLMNGETKLNPAKRLCKAYLKKLDDGAHPECIAESFVKELSAVANSEISQKTLDTLTKRLDESKRDIAIVNGLHNLQSEQSYIVPMIEGVIVNYLTDKTAENRNKVVANLTLFESIKEVHEILEHLSYDAYEEKSGKTLKNVSLYESAKQPETKTYTQEEVDAMLNESKKETVAAIENAKTESKKVLESIETNINLHGTITNILRNTHNEDVKVLCEQYMSALNRGKSETLLYETFISSASKWNYLPAVDTELSALADRIEKYRQNIDLRKILEIMKSTSSYYLVPLIEDVVVDYCNNKNVNTRVVLRNRLQAYESDQYVRDIVNVIEHDDSIENTVVLGESVETLNPYVHTEKIFSPVQYIKENECVFNVRGSYYIRKDGNINKLSKNETNKLSESFKTLCNLVNSSNVAISEIENSIAVYDGKNKAVITESEININGEKVSESELDKLAFNSFALSEGSDRFYRNVKAINENFDKIAYIDFAKRVVSNRIDGKSADVFRLGNNIFVDLLTENLGTSTFYSNVNPIQCRKLLNEHMELNVSALFEDILPGQKKILEGIEDTKKEFESYLEELNDNKRKLEEMKADNPDSTAEIDDAIAAIDDEIKDTKEKYGKYTEDSDKFVNADKDDKSDDGEKKDDEQKKDEEKPAETAAEMQEPIETGIDNLVDAAVTMASIPEENPDEFADVEEFNEFDTPAIVTVNAGTEDPYGFKVLRVNYLENLKTGLHNGKGDVIVVIPSVDADGNVHDETKRVTFYLSPEREPVIANEYMPANMYIAIKNAILADPRTETVELDSEVEKTDPELPVDTAPVETPATDVPAVETPAIDSVAVETPAEIPAEVPAAAETVVPAEQAAPAETAEQIPDYPISLDVNPEDIKPIDKNDLENGMDKLGIEHSESEADAGAVCIKLNDKSQVNGLYKYFKEWKNWNENQFTQFFPELKKYFNNDGAIPVQAANESVNIVNVRTITDGKKDGQYIFPYAPEYVKAFGLTESAEHPNYISVKFENNQELYESYKKIADIAKNGKVDENVKMFLDSNAEKYEELCESNTYNAILPYNSFIAQRLQLKNVDVDRVDEEMIVRVDKDTIRKAKAVFKQYYGKAMPANVGSFLVSSGKSLNESFKIDITDDATGKTVTIYTSDEESKPANEAEEIQQPDFNSSFNTEDTTFEADKSMEFNQSEEKKDEDEKKDEHKDDEKKDGEEKVGDSEKKEDEKKEDSEKDEKKDEDEKKEEKTKKVFTFKKVRESVETKPAGHINEAATQQPKLAKPTVYDNVILKDGSQGQIICEMSNGNFIVSVCGRTIEAEPNSVKMKYDRPDTLEAPYKFDPKTLKGIFEQMVPCGMFMNGMKITPSDCYVKFSDYAHAGSDEEINLVIEGVASKVKRAYVRITEDVNEFANVNDYAEGFITDGNGIERERILVNKKDFERYVNESIETNPVRILAFDESGETKLKHVSGTIVKLK